MGLTHKNQTNRQSFLSATKRQWTHSINEWPLREITTRISRLSTVPETLALPETPDVAHRQQERRAGRAGRRYTFILSLCRTALPYFFQRSKLDGAAICVELNRARPA